MILPAPLPGALPDWRVLLGAHYRRLGAGSRHRRFLAPLGDASLQRVAERSRPDAVLATWLDGRPRAVLEMFCAAGQHAEIAISVEDAYQGQGHGRRLFDAGLGQARRRGVRTADLLFARDNAGIRHLVEAAGGRITCHGSDCEAQIDLWPDTAHTVPAAANTDAAPARAA